MVPRSLRIWFIVHFVADMLFAIPLFVAPVWFMGLFGFALVEPMTARLVAAALFGIGGVSFVVRNQGRETFISLLSLKTIWSLAAIIGIAMSIAEGAPRSAWLFLAIFSIFSSVWSYFLLELKKH